MSKTTEIPIRVNIHSEKDGVLYILTREDHAAIGVERYNAVRSERGVVSLDTSDGRAITNNVGHHSIVLVHEVRTSRSRLEVSCDRAAALTINELCTSSVIINAQ